MILKVNMTDNAGIQGGEGNWNLLNVRRNGDVMLRGISTKKKIIKWEGFLSK